MPLSRRPVTSFDVARLAGVSQPTVSRALRNLPGASMHTQERVRAAAAELGYVLLDSGRTMSTRRSRRIAVVADELTNPYYPQLVEPIRSHLAARDLQAVLVTHTERGQVGIDLLADGSYDGVILTTIRRGSSLPHDLTERGIAHVQVNRTVDHPRSPSCSVDNAAGMQLIAQLLTDLGHRRIAVVGGPLDTSTGHERSLALRAELHSRGVAVPRRWSRRALFEHDAGAAVVTELLADEPAPTAIVCGNDVIALGALSAARSAGLAVPHQVSIVGFDDIAPAAWPLVSLTTVRGDLTQLARTAVDLLGESAGAGQRRTVRIPVNLMLRGTHGPAPVR